MGKAKLWNFGLLLCGLKMESSLNVGGNMKIIKDTIHYNGEELFPVPLDIAKKYPSLLKTHFYLKTKIETGEEKFFKIRHDITAAVEILDRYEEKGCKEIYFEKEGYESFLKDIKLSLQSKIFDPSTMTGEKDRIMTLNEAYQLLRQSLNNLGLTDGTIQFAEEVNKASIQAMRAAPNLFVLFKKFKSRCQDGFLYAMFTSYFSTCILDEYSWSSTAIKEKVSLAALLMDLSLSEEDFKTVLHAPLDGDGLPSALYNQPKDLASKLTKYMNILGREVIQCVERHHEMPDGSGFPQGLDAQRIGRLPSTLIMGRYFAEQLIACEFDFQEKDDILMDLLEKFEYPHFNQGLGFFYKVLA